MDFSTGSQVPTEDEGAAVSAQQARRCASLRGQDRRRARRAPDRVRQGHAARPLSASRRELSGPVRARRRRLRRRCRPRAARLRLHLEAVVHAGDAGAVQRRHRPRPSDQLLSEQRLRQPRRHRRHLERECLAGVEGRRHRHLLGPGARHRRAGRAQRQDQRHHPVRPRHGLADAGDQPGLAAPRLGRLLPRHLASRRSRSSSKSASPRATSTARRSTCTTACSSPTSSWKRFATAPSSSCAARRTGRSAARSTPARCSRSWSRPASRPASRTSSSSTR